MPHLSLGYLPGESVRQKVARLLVDRQTGKVASMGLWETEAAVRASIEWNAKQVAGFTSLFSGPATVGLYELIEDISPES